MESDKGAAKKGWRERQGAAKRGWRERQGSSEKEVEGAIRSSERSLHKHLDHEIRDNAMKSDAL